MKKEIVVVFGLGLLSSGVFAQNSVTLYGVIDAGVTATKIRDYSLLSDDMERHSRIGMDSGNLNASRLGIKGVEDLGSGTSAIFNVEAGFNVDEGTAGDAYSSALFGRKAVVGLKNQHYGELTLGRQDTIFGDTMKQIDPFADGSQYTGKSFMMYDSLMSNSLAYTTPEWHGLYAKFNYAFGENTNTDKKGNFYGASLNYSSDNAHVTLAYGRANYALDWAQYKVGNQPTSGAFDNYRYAFNIAVPTTREQIMLAASYDLKSVKPFAVVTMAKDNNPNYVYPEQASRAKDESAEIGITMPFGSSSIISSVSYSNESINIQGIRGVADAWSYKMGYTYDFSKRTTFYTLANYVKNNFKEEDMFRTQHDGYAELSVGIRHRF